VLWIHSLHFRRKKYKLKNEHSHEKLLQAEIEKLLVCLEIKKIAKTTHCNANIVISTALKHLEPTEKSKIPSKKTLMKSINKVRASKCENYTVLINEIPDYLYTTVSKNLFIQDIYENPSGGKNYNIAE
jgi:hypothetical protein